MLLPEQPPLPLQGGKIDHLGLFIIAPIVQHTRQLVSDIEGGSLVWYRNLRFLIQSPEFVNLLVATVL